MLAYRLCAAVAAVLLVTASAQAQSTCPHSEGDRDKVTRSIRSASSCKSAYDMMNACRSNSSGDVELAEIVIQRCEAAFLSGAAASVRRAYEEERALCRKRYARQQGTMYVSFAATCEAGVAARYAGAATRSRKN